MRFDRLDILRYGALADRSLAFRPDARLHIVYGPNEAGKSSALAAISDLLFGFPERTPYGFRSDAASLRIGASISSRGGACLEFRRRKGRKGTLLAASDPETSLPDDALALVEIPALAISSSDCRLRAQQSRPIWYLVPDGVVQYVSKRNLYTPTTEEARS